MENSLSIANEWKWVQLKEISHSIQYGYTESSSKERVGPKFLRITDIQDNNVIWDDVPYCRIDEHIKDKYLLKDGDLVFARTGATVGKSFLIKGEIPEAVFASYLIRVRTNEAVDQRYLYNFFQSSVYWRQITEGQVGIGQPNVNGTKLGQLLLPVPAKQTQQAIVSKIEELFSELDKAIENLRLAQQQLKTYRQSVLKWAFEGKLTNSSEDVPGTGIEPNNVPRNGLKPLSMVAEEQEEYGGKLPKGWEKIQIKDIAETYGGYAFKSADFKVHGKYQVIRMGNVRPGLLRLNENAVFLNDVDDNILSKALLKRNDVIITQTGTRKKRDYGFTTLINTNNLLLNQRIASIRFSNKLLPKFFLYYSWTDSFKDQFFANETGNVGQGNVGMKAVTETYVPFCSMKKQQHVVEEIESRLSVADKMEESINQSLQQAEALRQSILKKAFEGKLVATDTIKTIKATTRVIPFERKVLAGKIIHLFTDDVHFGLTKFQKIFYLVENFAEVPYETNFIQERAGPYDKDFTTTFRKEMQEKDWVQEEQRRSITKLVPGEKIGSLIVNYPQYFRDKGKDIVFVMKHLKDKSTHEAELIATLYAVWNNRLIRKQCVKIDSLVEGFFEWSTKKKEEFSEEEVVNIYSWMKEVKLVPKGFGNYIMPNVQ